MEISDHYETLDGSVLHYLKTGNGAEKLLIFHGFGQDHQSLRILATAAASQYTCYLFDLFFHGKSHWAHGERVLTKKTWKNILHGFLTKNSIQTFSLVGFSMGARFVLASVEAFPSSINNVYLIAPDGIKTSFWYTIATYPYLLRKLFKSTITHPKIFKRLLNALTKSKLVDQGLLIFASYQMDTELKRQRVYHSWVVFRRLRSNRRITSIINRKGINVLIIAGEHDNVIKPEDLRLWAARLPTVKMKVLPVGHHGIIRASIPYILSPFFSK